MLRYGHFIRFIKCKLPQFPVYKPRLVHRFTCRTLGCGLYTGAAYTLTSFSKMGRFAYGIFRGAA